MTTLLTFNREFEWVARYFKESESALIPHLYFQKRVISSFHTANDHFVLFNAPDLAGHHAIIDGVTLALTDIRDMMMNIYNDALHQSEDLLFHCSEFTLNDTDFIHDLPRCQTGGYGFLDDLCNPWHQKRTLLEHVLSDPVLYDKFAYRSPQGQICWKPGPCFLWMCKYYDLQVSIFILIVSTFGATAHGSEMWSTTIRNIPGGRMCNVFVLFNILMLRGTYNKASKSDQHLLCIPFPQFGRLVIRILAFARPLFSELQAVFRPHMVHNSTYCFYAGLDRPINMPDFSRTLQNVYYSKLRIQMNLRLLRQFYTFIMSQNCDLFPLNLDVREDSQQFGHSQFQHDTNYSQHSQLPLGIATGKFLGTSETSAVFQAMLGFPKDLMIKLHVASGWRNKLGDELENIRRGRFITSSQQVVEGLLGSVSSSAEAITVDNIVNGLQETLLPILMKEMNRRDAQWDAELIHLLSPLQTTFPTGQALVKPTSIDISSTTLSAFRKARGLSINSTEAFTGLTQAEVCQLMLDANQNVGYFNATGKSSSFYWYLKALNIT